MSLTFTWENHSTPHGLPTVRAVTFTSVTPYKLNLYKSAWRNPAFFETPKEKILVEILYCIKNERFPKRFFKKDHELLENICDVKIKWVTKKVKQLFKGALSGLETIFGN